MNFVKVVRMVNFANELRKNSTQLKATLIDLQLLNAGIQS